MNLKKYPSYRDTGIEWIGRIPRNWKISKIKYQTTINPQTLSENTENDYKIKYLDIGNVDENGNIIEVEEYNFGDAPSRARRIVKNGDTIVSTVRTYLKAITSIRNAPENLICSTGFAVLRPTKGIDAVFLSYLIRSTRYVDEIVRRSTGVSYPAITSSEIGDMECILPDLKTQKTIGEFLDKKTSEIDSLVVDKERLIELLEEKRQAIITEVVTKGLNRNVEYKSSKIDWINEIPAHWEEKRIKYIFYDVNNRNYQEDAQLLSLYTSIGVKPRKEMEERGNKAQTVINYKIVRKGDIVVNRILAWMGAIGLSEYEGVTSPDYDVYRALNDNVNSRYFHYYFRTPFFKGDCYKYGRGIMMMRWRTYPDSFKSILVPLPPIEEQDQIVEYLDKVNAEIESLKKEINTLITKLKEYRQSIIYEAVTGKIDVSDCPIERKEETHVY